MCTGCGAVVRKWWIPDEKNQNFVEEEALTTNTNESKAATEFHRLMVRAYPREERDRKRRDSITKLCFKLDAAPTVKTRAMLLYDNHKAELSSLKPIKKMLLACIIVAGRSCDGAFIPMSAVRRMCHESYEGLKKYTDAICRIIGLNQKTFSLKAIPYVASQLSLPFSCERVMAELYDKVCIIAPSIAPETRLAIAACKLLKERNMELNYEYIATVTDTTEGAIKSFFEKNRKRRADTTIPQSTKKKPKA